MPSLHGLSTDCLVQFQNDGFVVVENLLNVEEIELLRRIATSDCMMKEQSYNRDDGEGGAVKLMLRNEAGDDDIYAAIARSHRVVDRMEQLLDGEVYHYHQKTVMKEPKVGGAWAWHQDYGYWYHNGCLLPDMGSCMIAVDRSTKENGCLQVVRGSHRMGRIEHGPVGEQTGADPERVAAILERMELVYVELEPGSAVFFHSNLLHRSNQNRSEDPRWVFICCYNTKRNNPYRESRHPRYAPLEKWDDSRILEMGRFQWERISANER